MADTNENNESDKPVIGKETVKKEGKKVKKYDKWNINNIETFLELYEGYPCLWGYKLAEYKDRNLKEDGWLQIVKGMNMPNFTVKDAKEKMRSLRNTYSNELVKITKSKSSGSGLDDVYTPTRRWFPTMDRILGAVVKTRESQIIGIPNEDGNKDQRNEESQDIDAESDEHQTPRIKRKITTDHQTVIPPKIRTAFKTKTDERVQKIESSIITLKEISDKAFEPRNVQMTESNEFDLFGQFVASQLKKLPESSALLAMQHIQTHLFELRMKRNIQPAQHNNVQSPSQNLLSPSPNYSSHSNIEYSRVGPSEESAASPVYHNMDTSAQIVQDNNLLSMAINSILNEGEGEETDDI
ncbi:hypothetical protein J6590_103434 [Homalodisca vitripennis]|nr:hypothetical protein J6590_103434 [Homalodisca vitripennis]